MDKIETYSVKGLERLVLMEGYIGEITEKRIEEAWLNYYERRLITRSREYHERGLEIIRGTISEYKQSPSGKFSIVMKDRLDFAIKEIFIKETEESDYDDDDTTEDINGNDINSTRVDGI